tara:strand:- start:963 stop:1562 length:600 start_codon:yes stop_codon:yes gene_type:complete
VKRIRLLLMSALLSVACIRAVEVRADAAEDEGESGWVEKNLNPRTEWVEGLMTPFNRWVEKNIQQEDALPASDRALTDFNTQPPPAGLISPQEAGRLILLLESGQVLKVEYMATEPPAYKVRLLSEQGSIQQFYVNALDGTLLDDEPVALPDDESAALLDDESAALLDDEPAASDNPQKEDKKNTTSKSPQNEGKETTP